MKKNLTWYGIVLLCLSLWSCESTHAEWTGDALEILNIRQASNDALKAYDVEKELSYMTDNVLITTGNGALIQGREKLREYITTVPANKMYWVRTPDEIDVNPERGLAWETGTWKGYQADEGNEPVTGGKYAAMWTKQDGFWKIKSELFVTLDN